MSDEKPWQESEFRTIIEDARTRHGAVVALMYSLDGQAIGLLRLYATLGIATASGALAGLGGTGSIITRPLALGLLFAAVVLVIGAVLCFIVLRSIRINLPGRDPDFWQWAMHPGVDRSQVLAKYLENLKEKAIDNLSRNAFSSRALKWAKMCGAGAPAIALLTGLVALHYGF
jgi:hypothetical protein